MDIVHKLPYESPTVELLFFLPERIIAQSIDPLFNGFNEEVIW